MAVAGFDDIPTLRDVRPALTTVRLPLAEIGRQALRLALDTDSPAAAPDGGRAHAVLRIRPEVVVRDSTPKRA